MLKRKASESVSIMIDGSPSGVRASDSLSFIPVTYTSTSQESSPPALDEDGEEEDIQGSEEESDDIVERLADLEDVLDSDVTSTTAVTHRATDQSSAVESSSSSVLQDPVTYIKVRLQEWIRRLSSLDLTDCLEKDAESVFHASARRSSAPVTDAAPPATSSGSFPPANRALLVRNKPLSLRGPLSVNSLSRYFTAFALKSEEQKIQALVRILGLLSFDRTITSLRKSVEQSNSTSSEGESDTVPSISSDHTHIWTHFLSALPHLANPLTPTPSLPQPPSVDYYSAFFSNPSLRRPSIAHNWARSKAKVEDVVYRSADGNFLVVADGHGGRDAAEWFTHRITVGMNGIFDSKKWDFRSRAQRGQFRRAVVRLFKAADIEYCEARKKEWLQGSSRRDDGCTMTVSVFYDGWYINANIGDSKAVLFSLDPDTNRFQPCFISHDHDLHHEKVVGVLKRGGRAIHGDNYSNELYRLDMHSDLLTPEEFLTCVPVRIRLAPHPACEDRFKMIPTKYINMSDSLGDTLFKEGAGARIGISPEDEDYANDSVFEARPDVTFVRMSDAEIFDVSEEQDADEESEYDDADEDDDFYCGTRQDSGVHYSEEKNKRFILLMATDGFWDLISTDQYIQHQQTDLSGLSPKPDEVKAEFLASVLSRTGLSRSLTEEEYRAELKRTCCGMSDYSYDPFCIYKNVTRMRYLDDLSLLLTGIQYGNGWRHDPASSSPTPKRRKTMTSRSSVELSPEDVIFS